MTGMRKRVTVGFLSIVCLLFFSGMVSFIELSRLSRDTGEILGANQRNIELAREMLDAVHAQNGAMVRRSVFGDRSYDSLCRAGIDRLERALLTAQEVASDKSFLDSLAFATTELRVLTDNFLAYGIGVPAADSLSGARADSMRTAAADSLGSRWYNEVYEVQYDKLISAINNYMTSTQSSLAPRAERMKTNAYRAVTPVLISLVVMIAIVLMFCYFILVYCVSPVERMNKSLENYLAFRVPFVVKGELKDEMLALKEKIESLINLIKQSK